MSLGAKEALLSILENRLDGLQDHGAESREMFKGSFGI